VEFYRSFYFDFCLETTLFLSKHSVWLVQIAVFKQFSKKQYVATAQYKKTILKNIFQLAYLILVK